MKIKNISFLLIFSLLLFLLIAGVSAANDNVTNEIIQDDIGSSDMGESISGCDDLSCIDEDSNEEITASSEDSELEDSNGEYVDASEAYTYLNEFRTESNVWQWNDDDTTKSYFNSNDTVWLYPLERDLELEETAKIRAKELVESFSHYRPDGTICFTIFPDGLLNSGENIAMYYETCWDVTEGWKETNEDYYGQGHRRNMLDPNYNRVGIAGYKIDGIIYWVQNFGLRDDPQDFDSSDSFHFDDNAINPEFSLQVPIYANGTFTVKVDGNELKNASLFQGKSNITIYGLAPGVHSVELFYSGDYNHNSAGKTLSITVLEDPNLPEKLSFSHLNTLIQMAGDELVLEKDYAFNSSIDSDFKYGIPINRGLVIDGQGHSIDAKGLARIFEINAYSVTLKNITFANGNSRYAGGAIYSDYGIDIIGSTFINNSGSYGGAIYSYNLFNIANSTFINNSAVMDGGAVYNAYVVEGSSFSNNHASNLGGAIYSKSYIYLSDSRFEHNTNLHIFTPGGFSDNNNVFINDEYFDLFANATLDNGIVTLENDWNASQTVLINGRNVVIDGNGHTIDAQNKTRIFYITGNNVTIKNINLINGNSPDDGAAIYAKSTSLLIINASFENNTAAVGGAINLYYASLTVENSTFINNTAETGGAILSEGGIIRVNGSLFDDNDVSAYGGGAIYTDSDLYISNSSFMNNDVPKYGGAIFAFQESKTFIRDSIFSNNTSMHYGGAISCMDLEIFNSSFINNSAIDPDNSHGLEGLPSFIHSPAEGGVITSWGDVLINGSRFINNTAEECGVLYLYNDDGNLTVISSEFTNNTALSYSGVMAITTNALIQNSSFINNTAMAGSCGAIMNYQNLTVTNSSFINNSAMSQSLSGTSGGAICSNGDNLFIEDSSFVNNSANKGGAVYNHFYGNLTVDNSTFSDNYAREGGSLYQNDDDYRELGYSNANVTVNGSHFLNNSAEKGGAIYNKNTSFMIVDSDFSGNNASDGGTIKNGLGSLYLVNSTVSYDDENDALVGKVNITGSIILEKGNDVTLDYINNNRTHGTNVKVATKLESEGLTATYNVNKYLVITLKDAKGEALANKNVTVKVGSISKTLITNAKGQASLLVSCLLPKSYTAEISFAGDSAYLKSSATAKVIVRKATPKLTAMAKTFKINVKTKNYKITLKNNMGKVMKNTKVTLKVNRKTFTTKTNSKGVATFKITNLKKKGKFTAVITYAGSKYYNKVVKKPKITVKK